MLSSCTRIAVDLSQARSCYLVALLDSTTEEALAAQHPRAVKKVSKQHMIGELVK